MGGGASQLNSRLAQRATYNYPSDLGTRVKGGQHYMLIESFESRNAVDTGTTVLSSIALYIPPNALKTSFTQNYEGLEGGALKASTGAGLENLLSDGRVSLQGILGGVLGTLQQTGAKLANKGAFLSAGFGLATNSHTALVYRGPSEFRTHDFTFNFFPKNRTDATTVKNIISEFQRGMLPQLAGTQINSRRLSSPFFKSPRHFRIKFFKGGGQKNDFLFDIKTSVITSMNVNHDPNSIVSFHNDGSPIQSQLTLTFKEIEYVVSDESPSVAVTQAADTVVEQANAAAQREELESFREDGFNAATLDAR